MQRNVLIAYKIIGLEEIKQTNITMKKVNDKEQEHQNPAFATECSQWSQVHWPSRNNDKNLTMLNVKAQGLQQEVLIARKLISLSEVTTKM